LLSLKGHLHSVNRAILPWMMAGQIPTIAVGVWIITVLDQQAQGLLQLLLGIFILLGSASMMIRPVALAQVSPSWACLVAGIGGGLSGGMFSASGPVIGWFTYRQPLELAVIRATMLAFFAVASSLRTVVVAVHGGITPDVLWLSLIALPFVTVGAWLGRVVPPNISDRAMKRAVFGLLLVWVPTLQYPLCCSGSRKSTAVVGIPILGSFALTRIKFIRRVHARKRSIGDGFF
jgi:uncharacterized membrane protein YfcA